MRWECVRGRWRLGFDTVGGEDTESGAGDGALQSGGRREKRCALLEDGSGVGRKAVRV